MIDIIAPLIALLTIFFGAIGMFAPRWTAQTLDFAAQGSTMGFSELRAGAGGLFVALGLYCLLTGAPGAYGALGVAYLGAGAGRFLSILVDRPPMPKAAVFLAFEWGPAAILLWLFWPL